ncbi:hypothetical protein JQC72_10540 [Polycladomyces sp. WAk]|uniref:Uncharacterized protein n=1 Tax=Polycladomyces zharkentensis TaxID=2807616 RepID=A0ABS2WKF1_9BACL|nr:hypothetical protein [Polycladomyces sp. WAk]MBN2909953.1 hypothetical protein [Polycladomyces sp. WAk]
MAIYSEVVKLLQMIENWQQTDEQTYQWLCHRIEQSVAHAQHSDINDLYRIVNLKYEKLLELPMKLMMLVFKTGVAGARGKTVSRNQECQQFLIIFV